MIWLTFVVLAVLLAACGVWLIWWAFSNPAWQGAESHDALGPLIVGGICIALAIALCIVRYFVNDFAAVLERMS